MNYGKVIGSVLTLFPRKIKVSLLDYATGKLIGDYKMAVEMLPTSFDKPTVVTIEGTSWQILQANPLDPDEFTFSRKLTLSVTDAIHYQPATGLYQVPSIASPFPVLTSKPLFKDLVLKISPNTWRQIEFLPAVQATTIETELQEVEATLYPADEWNNLKGYRSQHIRKTMPSLSIPWETFCTTIGQHTRGALCHESLYIENGFVVQTSNYTYYGLLENDLITTLCLETFESPDEEFFHITQSFRLLLASWCTGSMLLFEVPEDNGPEPMRLFEKY